MKILDFMSFNVEWFLTTQGMLITGGVLLLLIALVILLTSGKKEDNTEPTADIASGIAVNDLGVSTTVPSQIGQPQVVPEVPTLEPIAPVESVSQPEVSQPVNLGGGIADVAPVSQSVTESIDNSTQPLEQQTVVPSVLEINSMPVQSQVAAQDIPALEPVVPVVDPTPVMPNISEFNIPDPIAVANANIDAAPVAQEPVPTVQEVQQQPSVSIYGGVNPTQDIYKPVETAKPVIYGGADPLENTGAIPKVEVDSVQQPVPEVNVVEPVVPTPSISETAVVNNEQTATISEIPQVLTNQQTDDEIEELVF